MKLDKKGGFSLGATEEVNNFDNDFREIFMHKSSNFSARLLQRNDKATRFSVEIFAE